MGRTKRGHREGEAWRVEEDAVLRSALEMVQPLAAAEAHRRPRVTSRERPQPALPLDPWSPTCDCAGRAEQEASSPRVMARSRRRVGVALEGQRKTWHCPHPRDPGLPRPRVATGPCTHVPDLLGANRLSAILILQLHSSPASPPPDNPSCTESGSPPPVILPLGGHFQCLETPVCGEGGR